MMNEARAYVYHSEWVADCPRDCGNVEFLFEKINPRKKTSPRIIRKNQFACSYCKLVTPIEWPANEESLMMALMVRPVPHTRNWYPKGHPVALRYGLPDGQSIHDLVEEARQHGVIPPEKKAVY